MKLRFIFARTFLLCVRVFFICVRATLLCLLFDRAIAKRRSIKTEEKDLVQGKFPLLQGDGVSYSTVLSVLDISFNKLSNLYTYSSLIHYYLPLIKPYLYKGSGKQWSLYNLKAIDIALTAYRLSIYLSYFLNSWKSTFTKYITAYEYINKPAIIISYFT